MREPRNKRHFLTWRMTILWSRHFEERNTAPSGKRAGPRDSTVPRKLRRISSSKSAFPSLFQSVCGELPFLRLCRLPRDACKQPKTKRGGGRGGAPQLSHRVAHGKVCTGAGALSVWVKASDTFGLGTALCWVTPLREIFSLQRQMPVERQSKVTHPLRLESISFRAVSHSRTKGNVPST